MKESTYTTFTVTEELAANGSLVKRVRMLPRSTVRHRFKPRNLLDRPHDQIYRVSQNARKAQYHCLKDSAARGTEGVHKNTPTRHEERSSLGREVALTRSYGGLNRGIPDKRRKTANHVRKSWRKERTSRDSVTKACGAVHSAAGSILDMAPPDVTKSDGARLSTPSTSSKSSGEVGDIEVESSLNVSNYYAPLLRAPRDGPVQTNRTSHLTVALPGILTSPESTQNSREVHASPTSIDCHVAPSADLGNCRRVREMTDEPVPENIRPTPQNLRYGTYPNQQIPQSWAVLGSGRLQNSNKSGMPFSLLNVSIQIA